MIFSSKNSTCSEWKMFDYSKNVFFFFSFFSGTKIFKNLIKWIRSKQSSVLKIPISKFIYKKIVFECDVVEEMPDKLHLSGINYCCFHAHSFCAHTQTSLDLTHGYDNEANAQL